MTMKVAVGKIVVVDGPYGHQALVEYKLLVDKLVINCSIALPEEEGKGEKKADLLTSFISAVEKKLAIVHGILSEEKRSPALLINQKRE